MISKCAVCNGKKCKFIKKEEAKDLLSKLAINTPLKKYRYWVIFCFKYLCVIMNEIVNKFLLVGDKFMPQMH